MREHICQVHRIKTPHMHSNNCLNKVNFNIRYHFQFWVVECDVTRWMQSSPICLISWTLIGELACHIPDIFYKIASYIQDRILNSLCIIHCIVKSVNAWLCGPIFPLLHVRSNFICFSIIVGFGGCTRTCYWLFFIINTRSSTSLNMESLPSILTDR